DTEKTPGWPGRRLALLLPALTILAAVIYLLIGNPGAEELAARRQVEVTPIAVATAARASSAVNPVSSATASPALAPEVSVNEVPPFLTGFLEEQPALPKATVDDAPWGPGPPRIVFVARYGAVYRFQVEGFQPGESLLRERTRLLSSIAGYPLKLLSRSVRARMFARVSAAARGAV